MVNKWEQTQPIASRILMNSLAKQRLSHAILFHGQPLAIQLEFARFVIQAKLCREKNQNQPCGHCSTCNRIMHGMHPDIILIEPDGASVKKEQVQQLQRDLSQTSFETGEQFYIIVSAELMTIQAANSLLKFLEEPTGQQIAFLLVSNPTKLLTTILSRVQVIQLLPPNQQQRMTALVTQGMNEQYAFYASVLTADYERLQQLVQDEQFQQLVHDVEAYVEQLELQGQSPLIAQIKLEKWFAKRQQALEVVQLLIAIYEQLYHHKQANLGTIGRKLETVIDRQVYQNRLKQLLKLERNLRANALLALALTAYHIALINGSE
ncbi:MAG: hypothetical protein ACRCZG_05960 [Culicoidibacterales bacterium]